MSMLTTQNYIQSFLNTGHGSEPGRNFAIFVPASISIITGYFNQALAPTVSLTDVSSSATITVEQSPQSNSYVIDPNNANYFYILQNGNYTFLISYTDTGVSPNITYTNYLSFEAILPLLLPQTTDIYNLIKRNEPQGVYTQLQSYVDKFGNTKYTNEYVDVESTAEVFETLYGDLNTIYQNILPTGGSSNWEFTLNNSVGLLSNVPSSPTSQNPYYALILDMLYSLLVNRTGNKFDVCFFVSKYLWYRSNKTISSYVYINEVVNALPPIWILGTSALGATTVLTGGITPVIYQVNIYVIPQSGTITLDLQQELTNLIPAKLLPEGYGYSVIFNKSLSDLGLSVSLGQTWKYDPRLKDFAIEFVSTNVAQANGYVNPIGNPALVSVAMSPATGTSFSPGTSSYTITGTYYTGATRDLTLFSTISSSNDTVMTIPSLGTLSANSAGSVTINFNYGIFKG